MAVMRPAGVGTVACGAKSWIACRVSVLLAVVIAMGFAAPASAAVQPAGDATATVETVPVLSTGDAADDPAVWVHPSDPARSVVIGNDKGGALEVYDLSGARIQRIAEGFFGNVDVRRSVPVGSGAVDVVGVYRLGLRFYRINPATRTLTNITDDPTGSIRAPFGGEGFCLYRSPSSGRLSAFVNARDGRIAQFELGDADGDGLIDGRQVRAWDVGGEVEGCVADDGLGKLYVSEEAVGIWKYGAEPTAPTGPAGRVLVDGTTANGGRLVPDVEGLTIVYQPNGTGYLIASSQAASNTANFYAVYARQGVNAFVRSFRVVNGRATDGCGRTDGIDAVAANLGPAFPQGIFVCQDNNNSTPGTSGNQNFKLVPLERVVGLG
jgi:myo-inositol-hexaphosphate 3-phosphohydrolase